MSLGQEQIGQRIKRAREDAGLTQAQLQTLIGLEHPQSISNYERGITEVPAARLRKIADATKKPLSYFLDDEPAEPQVDPDLADVVRSAIRDVLANRPAPEGIAPGDAWADLERQLQAVGEKIGEAAVRIEAAVDRLASQQHSQGG